MLNQIEKKTKHHSVSLIPQAFVDTTYPEYPGGHQNLHSSPPRW